MTASPAAEASILPSGDSTTSSSLGTSMRRICFPVEASQNVTREPWKVARAAPSGVKPIAFAAGLTVCCNLPDLPSHYEPQSPSSVTAAARHCPHDEPIKSETQPWPRPAATSFASAGGGVRVTVTLPVAASYTLISPCTARAIRAPSGKNWHAAAEFAACVSRHFSAPVVPAQTASPSVKEYATSPPSGENAVLRMLPRSNSGDCPSSLPVPNS